MQPHRMPIVLLHELLNREQMRLVGKAPVFGQPDLFIKRQNFLRHAGSNMQK